MPGGGDVSAVWRVPGGWRPVLRGLRRVSGAVPVLWWAGQAGKAVLPRLRAPDVCRGASRTGDDVSAARDRVGARSGGGAAGGRRGCFWGGWGGAVVRGAGPPRGAGTYLLRFSCPPGRGMCRHRGGGG